MEFEVSLSVRVVHEKKVACYEAVQLLRLGTAHNQHFGRAASHPFDEHSVQLLFVIHQQFVAWIPTCLVKSRSTHCLVVADVVDISDFIQY